MGSSRCLEHQNALLVTAQCPHINIAIDFTTNKPNMRSRAHSNSAYYLLLLVRKRAPARATWTEFSKLPQYRVSLSPGMNGCSENSERSSTLHNAKSRFQQVICLSKSAIRAHQSEADLEGVTLHRLVKDSSRWPSLWLMHSGVCI